MTNTYTHPINTKGVFPMFKHGLQIGLLLFGMFFGAGNLIFPPSLGFMSGGMFAPAILGFLLSGIGMPVIALIIGTFNPGGFAYV